MLQLLFRNTVIFWQVVGRFLASVGNCLESLREVRVSFERDFRGYV